MAMDDRSKAAKTFAALTLHLLCCGAPLVLFAILSIGSSVSWQRFAGALPSLAILGSVFAAGGLYYYFAHGCRRCALPDDKR